MAMMEPKVAKRRQEQQENHNPRPCSGPKDIDFNGLVKFKRKGVKNADDQEKDRGLDQITEC